MDTETKRERKTGRYAPMTLAAPCKCGHTLGQHVAERHRGEQPCVADDCGCECFKRAK